MSLSKSVTYLRICRIMSKPPGQRGLQLTTILPWFGKKSDLFANIDQETLLDVIQHCDFVTRNRDDVIITQGERGHRFFIILRGSVSVMLKDAMEDVDLGDEKLDARHIPRESLGTAVVQLGEGATFGELALIHPDCVRTASIIADEKTDLVVIHRDLYNRSVSKVIAREYAEKMQFIDGIPLLKPWPQKIKRQLAVSFRKEVHNFDSYLVKQGDPITDLYFIGDGEVKLMVNPEAHLSQFERFMQKCGSELAQEEDVMQTERSYFPQKLLPQLQKYSRVNKAYQLNPNGAASPSFNENFPLAWSPSAIRKMNVEMKSRQVNINLCYLGGKQMIGDIELLIGLTHHHASAICSRETTVMALHKNHFERLFRKKNPHTIKNLCKNIETQLTMRCLKSNIINIVPLLRCMLYKLQETNGERKAGDEKGFLLTLRALAQSGQNDHSATNPGLSRRSRSRHSRTVSPALSNGHRSLAGPDNDILKVRTLIVPKVDA